jgi:hypothetical protein
MLPGMEEGRKGLYLLVVSSCGRHGPPICQAVHPALELLGILQSGGALQASDPKSSLVVLHSFILF